MVYDLCSAIINFEQCSAIMNLKRGCGINLADSHSKQWSLVTRLQLQFDDLLQFPVFSGFEQAANFRK